MFLSGGVTSKFSSGAWGLHYSAPSEIAIVLIRFREVLKISKDAILSIILVLRKNRNLQIFDKKEEKETGRRK